MWDHVRPRCKHIIKYLKIDALLILIDHFVSGPRLRCGDPKAICRVSGAMREPCGRRGSEGKPLAVLDLSDLSANLVETIRNRIQKATDYNWWIQKAQKNQSLFLLDHIVKITWVNSSTFVTVEHPPVCADTLCLRWRAVTCGNKQRSSRTLNSRSKLYLNSHRILEFGDPKFRIRMGRFVQTEIPRFQSQEIHHVCSVLLGPPDPSPCELWQLQELARAKFIQR